VTAVVAYVPDLMDRSRVQAAAPGARFVRAPRDLAAAAAEADVVVVDLSRPGVLAELATLAVLPGRVVGFAPHVDGDLLAAAGAAGCNDVLPRSQFFRRVADILA
jgi:predicted short-subunit dehydrogenase-like oxidoreductase (DUF2520 family)